MPILVLSLSFIRTHFLIDSINSVAISPDGRFIASGSWDNSITVLDMYTKEQVHHFSNAHSSTISLFCMHTHSLIANINSVAISADGRFIVSGSDDNSIKVFDMQTKEQLRHFSDAHSGTVFLFCTHTYFLIESITSVAISADGRFIVSGSDDNSIKVFPLLCSRPVCGNSLASLFFIFLIDFYNQAYDNTERLLDVVQALKYRDPKTQKPTRLQNLFIHPYCFNFFHLAVIIDSSQISNPHVSYSCFKVPFMLDKFRKTPLHYLLARQPIDYLLVNTMFEYILEYLEDIDRRNPREVVYIMESLTPLFSTTVTKTNPKLRDRYLHLCCQTPPTLEPFPQFGDALSRYTFSLAPDVTSKIKDEIYRDGQDRIVFTTTMPYLNYKPTSDDMFTTAQTLNTIKSEEAFKIPFAKKLIDHLWTKTKFVTLVCGLIYSIYMLLFSVYIGLGRSILAFEAVIVCFTCFLLVAETIQMYMLKSKYFYDFWNLADLVQSFLIITFMALRIDRSCAHDKFEDSDAARTLAEQWISSLAILTGYLRWISYLRIFGPTRITFSLYSSFS